MGCGHRSDSKGKASTTGPGSLMYRNDATRRPARVSRAGRAIRPSGCLESGRGSPRARSAARQRDDLFDAGGESRDFDQVVRCSA